LGGVPLADAAEQQVRRVGQYVLGQGRARAACAFLARHGVRAELTAVTFGRDRPRASNATERGRELNRRVEIVVER
jgi:OmpA-OmpF porin, OOP family